MGENQHDLHPRSCQNSCKKQYPEKTVLCDCCQSYQHLRYIRFVRFWLGIDFKWVMKKEIRKYPGVGFGSEAVGHIFVDRSSTAKAIASINEAKRKIINGTSVIFIAEGTHSKNSALLPFKKGAFKMAFDLQLPMLPITINSTDRVWPTGIFNIFPGKVEIFVHPAIDIYDSQEIQIPELMRRTRDTIASAREK